MTERDGRLGRRRRRLVRLSAALASDCEGAREEALDRTAAAVEGGALDREEVEEAILQSYLFLGYPAALSALADWRERMPGEAPESDPLARPERLEAWEERGREVCRAVYGGAYRKLRRRVARLHPAVDRWMVTEGYGKVLGRPGLPLVDRELCIAAVLAVRGWAPQLHSHLRGALRAGAGAGAVGTALELALEATERPGRAESAREVWRQVRRRVGAGDVDGSRGGATGAGPSAGDEDDGAS